MTHDLLLHLAEGRGFDEIQAALRASERTGALVSDEHSTPEQAVLLDLDTAVHAVLAPGAPPEDDEAGEDAHGPLLLQIPYLRPRFFAEQAAAWAAAIAAELGATIEDPQEGRRSVSERDIVAAWEKGNRAIVEELEAPPEGGAPPPEKPRAVPSATLEAVYRHNRSRRELRELAGPDVQIPGLALAVLPMRLEPAVVCRYEPGEPAWLPDAATHVVLERRKRGFLGSKADPVLVEAAALRERLTPAADGPAAPRGVTAYAPGKPADDPSWASLEGSPARGLALLDWAGVVDG